VGLAHPNLRPLSQRARSMSGARAAASSSDDAAATVAPLVELWKRSVEILVRRQRWARALELAERAEEQARRNLPPNNLVVAWMTGHLICHRMASGNMARESVAEALKAWTSDARLQAMSRERLATCCARFEAGTLCTPTLEERAFFADVIDPHGDVPPLERLGEGMLLSATYAAIDTWITADSEEVAVLIAGVKSTLQTALSLDARGELLPWLRKREKARDELVRVLAGALGDSWLGPIGPLTYAFPPETKAALRRLQARLPNVTALQTYGPMRAENPSVAAWNACAAADVARHGLQTCALPACDAKEPHPRFFKCCSRCRSVFYCSQEHQREDWPRHRAADRCTKPASS